MEGSDEALYILFVRECVSRLGIQRKQALLIAPTATAADYECVILALDLVYREM